MLFLAPGQSAYYTWINPKGSRKLIWSVEHGNKIFELENSLQSDAVDIIELGNDENGQVQLLAWVSFLDGMQRVLLFTDNIGLGNSLAHTTGEHERIDQVSGQIHSVEFHFFVVITRNF